MGIHVNPGHKPKAMRILCIQLKQLGDVLMTTPAVRALSQHFEGCEIDFLTQRPANAIYEHNPYVRRVYSVQWQARELLPLLIEFRRQKYDVLIDFSGSSKTALFGWATRIPKRIGFDGQKKSWCFTDNVVIPANRHYTADKKSALRAGRGSRPAPCGRPTPARQRTAPTRQHSGAVSSSRSPAAPLPGAPAHRV